MMGVRISTQDLAPFFSRSRLVHRSGSSSRCGTRSEPTTIAPHLRGGSRRPTEVPGGQVASKDRLDSAYGARWRLTVGSWTDLKIMVSPVRIRVPPLIKILQMAGKYKGLRVAA